jgi:cytochrome c-type biogenesis protein CcmH
MIGFLIFAAVLLAAGLFAVLWPLLRGEDSRPVEAAEAVVTVFRDQLRELDAERAGGTVAEAQYEASRREIERNLLAAVAAPPAVAPAGPRRARLTAALAGLFVVFLPLGLYTFVGSPDGLLPGADSGALGGAPQQAAAARAAAKPITSAQVQKMIDQLAEALKKNPNDAQAWTMLARAYAYNHQYDDAVRAFTKAVAISPREARLLADLADALAMTNNQRLDGEPMRLIERALQLDPTDIKALALAGTGAFDKKEYAKAVGYWERALRANPNDPEFAQNLRSSLDEARQLAGMPASADAAKAGMQASAGMDSSTGTQSSFAVRGAGAPPAASADAAPAARAAGAAAGKVSGKVSLSSALAAKAQPTDTVFVFARAAQGPRVPLAMLRRQVKDLPITFTLDDSMAMMPDFNITKYAPVLIEARISKSGDAIAAPGDLKGSSRPVPVGAQGVAVLIDQVVP